MLGEVSSLPQKGQVTHPYRGLGLQIFQLGGGGGSGPITVPAGRCAPGIYIVARSASSRCRHLRCPFCFILFGGFGFLMIRMQAQQVVLPRFLSDVGTAGKCFSGGVGYVDVACCSRCLQGPRWRLGSRTSRIALVFFFAVLWTRGSLCCPYMCRADTPAL